MNRRRILLAAPALLLASAVPALAEKLSLNEISAYLNSITSAGADFTQIADDGTISTGKILIKRPGRIRFEYAPPEDLLVLAGASTVGIFDGRSNTGPEQYPLKRTPLSIILERNVNLARRNMVTGHGYDGTATLVRAQDPEHPEYGSIELKFTPNPVELRQWIITDAAGVRTTVVLGQLANGITIPPHLFSITAETQRRSR